MPVNGIPSDDWKVNRALGPYARKMDADEEEELQKIIRQKNKSIISRTSSEDGELKMPF